MRLPSAQTTLRRSRWDPHVLALALITLVGLVLRLPSYTNSLNGDELSTYFIATGHGLGDVVRLVAGPQEVTPPLYLVLASLTQGRLGDPLDSLRVVPLLCGVAAMPLTWLLGVRTVGRRAATVGVALMALSPFLVFYATEARAYSLAMALTLGSSLALWEAVHRTRATWWWALYAVLTCAAMYTHYTAALVLAAQAAWALAYHRPAWRWIVGANVVAAVGWLPWLSTYRQDQDEPSAVLIGVLQPFGWGSLKTDLVHWAVGHPSLSVPARAVPGDVALLAVAAGVGLGLVGVAAALARRERRLPAEGTALVAVLALATPVLAALYSALDVSIFLPRNMISSTPGLVLALGWLVSRPDVRGLRFAATALLVAGFAVGGLRMLGDDARRPDLKAAASFIADQAGPDAVVVDLPGPSPGPISQLDAAANPGEPVPSRPTILRLGRPGLAAQLDADRPGRPGQFLPLPTPSPDRIAAEAVRLAAGRDVYLVNGLRDEAVLRRPARDPAAPVARFLAALPPAYRVTATERFEGFFGYEPVFVHVLSTQARGR